MRRLSYIGLGVADIAAWRAFAVEALGMMAEDDPVGLLLRLDNQAYRFAVHEAADDDLLYVGVECSDAEGLDSDPVDACFVGADGDGAVGGEGDGNWCLRPARGGSKCRNRDAERDVSWQAPRRDRHVDPGAAG